MVETQGGDAAVGCCEDLMRRRDAAVQVQHLAGDERRRRRREKHGGAGFSSQCRAISVLTTVGAMPFTVMPCGASSLACWRINMTRPFLLLQYAE